MVPPAWIVVHNSGLWTAICGSFLLLPCPVRTEPPVPEPVPVVRRRGARARSALPGEIQGAAPSQAVPIAPQPEIWAQIPEEDTDDEELLLASGGEEEEAEPPLLCSPPLRRSARQTQDREYAESPYSSQAGGSSEMGLEVEEEWIPKRPDRRDYSGKEHFIVFL